jgi:dolichol-phosphate mannosyltransferase
MLSALGQRCLVVLPTYNEASTIEQVIAEVLDRPVNARVLVVDDNSPDGTAALAERCDSGRLGRVSVLRRQGKQGLGRAYVAGFTAALVESRSEVIIQMDADGSHDPKDIDRLLDALSDHDLAIGSRYCSGGSSEGMSRPRQWLSRAGNAYARGVLAPDVQDLTGGFKAWRTELLRNLDIDTVTSDGYAFQIELTVRALKSGARLVEVPITFHQRRGGESKMNWKVAAEAIALVPWMATRNSTHHRGSTR